MQSKSPESLHLGQKWKSISCRESCRTLAHDYTVLGIAILFVIFGEPDVDILSAEDSKLLGKIP